VEVNNPRRLRVTDYHRGLPVRVYGSENSLRHPSSIKTFAFRGTKDCPEGGSGEHVRKTCNSPSLTREPQHTRILLPGIHALETFGSLASHPQHETPKQVNKTQKVSHGHDLGDRGRVTSGRICNLSRSKGRVLSCRDTQRRQEVLKIRSRQRSLRIPSATFRPFHSTKGVHTRSRSTSSVFKEKRHKDVLLLRRLAAFKSLRSQTKGTHALSTGRNQKCGVYSKQGEIRLNPYTKTCVPRSSTSHGEGSSSTFRQTIRHSRTLRLGPLKRRVRASLILAANARKNVVVQGISSLEYVEHATHSNVLSESVESHTTHEYGGNVPGSVNSPPTLVDGQRQYPEGGSLSPSQPQPSTNDRCVGRRVGGAHRRPVCVRDVGVRRGDRAYQRARATSGVQIATKVSPASQKQDSTDTIRQHHSSGVYKSSRRNEITFPMSLNVGPIHLVFNQQRVDEGIAPSRETERPSGRPVQGKTEPNRMGIKPENCRSNIPNIRETVNRSVRFRDEHSSPNVLLENPVPLGVGSRCVQSQLDEPARIRVSTDIADTEGTIKNRGGTVQVPSNCSTLASTTLVPKASASSGRASLPPTGEGGPTLPEGTMVSPTGEPALSCMAAVKRAYRESGLSEEAATLATASRRESTFRVYSSRVRYWNEWCSTRGHDPNTASVNAVADFLSDLHKLGRQSNTIAGYRTAVGTLHKGFEDGSFVSNNPVLHRIVQGAFTLRPPPQRLVPAWSLTLVLRALAAAPYEPLGKASLQDLTFKTAFLIALAAPRRSSETTALSIHEDHLVWTRMGVRLTTKVGFIAKNQRRNFTPTPIELTEMSKLSDTAEDKVWCPVRALKYYIHATKSIRKDDQLFVKTIKPHNAIKPTTLAGWLVKTIMASYPPGTCPGVHGKPRAHDVRGVATSWAKFNLVSVDDIAKAATWKSHNTFTACYMKDIVEAESRFGIKIMSAAAKAAKSK
jgi:hypothetical protein